MDGFCLAMNSTTSKANRQITTGGKMGDSRCAPAARIPRDFPIFRRDFTTNHEN